MKILHTSDWHLGRSLYGRKRYKEFSAFLDWLSSNIESENIDALLISGDVFDTTTPGNRAQELYYRFLCRVSGSCCHHIIITSGNHDSPTFLNAPKDLLRTLNVYVVGAMTENPEDEVIPIFNFRSEMDDLESEKSDFRLDKNKNIQSKINLQKSAIICAVPYLRDRDIRLVEPGESIEDKNKKLVEGIKNHYSEIIAIAEQKRIELLQQSKIKNPQLKIPIIAMGHLFTTGGKTVDGDGVRDLYVGSLAQVNEDVFSTSIDYLALGHLHIPQCVGNTEHIRYSGSPLPMGFGEAKQEKQVLIIEFKNQQSKIKKLTVPCFQPLERIAGSLDEILEKLEHLKQDNSTAWLEIEYTGHDIISNLREIIDETITGSTMEILRIKNKQLIDRVISTIQKDETLDDMDVNDVFERCLDAFDVLDEDHEELTASYNEIIRDLAEDDSNAE